MHQLAASTHSLPTYTVSMEQIQLMRLEYRSTSENFWFIISRPEILFRSPRYLGFGDNIADPDTVSCVLR